MCETCGCGNPYRAARRRGERRVEIEADVLGRNQGIAGRNRARLAAARVLALNFVSSPGSGKTCLLIETIRSLGAGHPIAVIEGDQQTRFDAERIAATGVAALQINTGKGCHLDAAQIARALEEQPLPEDGFLFIENVGNLVCPASFELGEAHKVVVLSVTEGEDKPLKYPDMFAASTVMLLNKVDLLPYLDFDVELCCEYARRVNPEIQIFPVSAKTGEGMDMWNAWLHGQRGRERC